MVQIWTIVSIWQDAHLIFSSQVQPDNLATSLNFFHSKQPLIQTLLFMSFEFFSDRCYMAPKFLLLVGSLPWLWHVWYNGLEEPEVCFSLDIDVALLSCPTRARTVPSTGLESIFRQRLSKRLKAGMVLDLRKLGPCTVS